MEIIKITETAKGTSVVSAKDLYNGLGFDQSHWAKWYDKNIIKNPFVKENEDWALLAISASETKRGNFGKDFTITLDFAKRLAMQAKTEKGEEIRSYFIACEKKALTAQHALPTTFKEALQALLEKETENERKALQIADQNKQLAIQAPAVAYVSEVLDSQSLLATTQVAMDLGLSAIALNAKLVSLNVIRKINKEWVLCAEWAKKEYGKSKTHTYTNSLGQNCTKLHLYWTEKGRLAIYNLLGRI